MIQYLDTERRIRVEPCFERHEDGYYNESVGKSENLINSLLTFVR